jgi:hypothetical protein
MEEGEEIRGEKSFGSGGGGSSSLGTGRTGSPALLFACVRIRLGGRVPRRQQGRPNHARHQNHVQLVPDGNVPEIEQLDRNLKGGGEPYRLSFALGDGTSLTSRRQSSPLNLLREEIITYPEDPLRLLRPRRIS